MIEWLWAKASKWLAIAGGIIVALGAALTFGLLKGEKMGSAKGDMEVAKERTQAANAQSAAAESDQKALNQAADAATEASNVVNALPDAGEVAPDVAPADSAAGKLRDAGWVQSSAGKTGKP